MPFPWNHAGSPRRRTLPCQARLQSLAAPDHRNVASSTNRCVLFSEQRRRPAGAPPRDENDQGLPLCPATVPPTPMILSPGECTGTLWARCRRSFGAGCPLGEQSAPSNQPDGDPRFQGSVHAPCGHPRGMKIRARRRVGAVTSEASGAIRPYNLPTGDRLFSGQSAPPTRLPSRTRS